jgi:multidrug efflux pump subunit AcrA (membrane-fusion protein)
VVQLPERDLPRIRLDQTAVLTGAYVDNSEVAGQISRISPVVDPTTGTVKVTIDVEPDQTSIRPGQYVKVRVEIDRHADVLTIPRRALVWDDGEPVAWRVIEAKAPEVDKDSEEPGEEPDEPGFLAGFFSDRSDEAGAEEEDADPWEGIPRRGVEKARLKVGYVDTQWVEVTDGLEQGDMVIAVGNGSLRAETLVKLPGDPEPVAKTDSADEEKADAGGPGSDDGDKG